MSFKVGDKVIAKVTVCNGSIQKGKEYTIGSFSGCCRIWIDVGVRTYHDEMNCSRCKTNRKTHGIWWLDINLFEKPAYNFAEGVLENILKNTDLKELEEIEEEYLIKK